MGYHHLQINLPGLTAKRHTGLLLKRLYESMTVRSILPGIVAIFLSLSASAQKSLEVPVRIEVEKGNFDNITVKVKKNGKDSFTQPATKNMKFKLEFNQQYSLVFTKDGYVTKTIEFNTKAPAPRIESGFEPYKIGVKLFLQTEENTVVYNQPVGRIKYDSNLDEFGFETDYSKSILSAMNDDSEKDKDKAKDKESTELKKADEQSASPATSAASSSTGNSNTDIKKEEKSATAATQTTTTARRNESSQEATASRTPAGGEENNVKRNPAGGEESGKKATINSGSEEKSVVTPVINNEKREIPSAKGGNENNRKKTEPVASTEKNKSSQGGGSSTEDHTKIKVSDGNDQPLSQRGSGSDTDYYVEQNGTPEIEKIMREDIVEKNRVIIKVKVTRGEHQCEYSCIDYSWGGRYFFKNNKTSISENLFRQWTGVQP